MFESQSFSQLMMANDFMGALMNSFVLILATEIGDKTFFIAAILAMKNGRAVVFAGAMSALFIMHVLSSFMGYALPAFLPAEFTHFLAAILFFYFGLKLLYDGYYMEGEGPSEELCEVESELIDKKKEGENVSGTALDKLELEERGQREQEGKQSAERLSWTVLTQAFTLTFLAEWGDRSQIATIALAANKNPWGVILGGIVGHAICTGGAVLGGRMLAARISERTVSLTGGAIFLLFAVHSVVFGPEKTGADVVEAAASVAATAVPAVAAALSSP